MSKCQTWLDIQTVMSTYLQIRQPGKRKIKKKVSLCSFDCWTSYPDDNLVGFDIDTAGACRLPVGEARNQVLQDRKVAHPHRAVHGHNPDPSYRPLAEGLLSRGGYVDQSGSTHLLVLLAGHCF